MVTRTKKSNEKVKSEDEFTQLIADSLRDELETSIRESIGLRKRGLVKLIREKLGDRLASNTVVEALPERSDWIGVESLSRLRSLVGGRFQNLKKKWVEVGFPLREHRGEKIGEYKVEQEAWIELSHWISKQGFEARLTPESREYLFELRSVGKK